MIYFYRVWQIPQTLIQTFTLVMFKKNNCLRITSLFWKNLKTSHVNPIKYTDTGHLIISKCLWVTDCCCVCVVLLIWQNNLFNHLTLNMFLCFFQHILISKRQNRLIVNDSRRSNQCFNNRILLWEHMHWTKRAINLLHFSRVSCKNY